MEFIYCPELHRFKPYLSKEHWQLQVNIANCKYCYKRNKCPQNNNSKEVKNNE